MEAATIVVKPTAKQAKVLGLIAKGKTVAQIAKTLGISTNGVYGHIRKLKDAGLLDERGKPTDLPPAPDPEQMIGTGSNGNGAVPEAMVEVKRILNQATEVVAKRLEAIEQRRDAILAEVAALEREDKGLGAEAEWLTSAAPDGAHNDLREV